ncbi:MAG: LLM class F420-dependent oxidoreductase [Nitrospinae bacterium]|nr:LLM class F420-dependent oxidoreductase [Nitrospinota bacterium]
MQIGCHLPTQGPVATREALLTFARKAEEHRMASLWVSDHVVFPKEHTGQYSGGRFPHAPETPYLEPVAVLAAAAMCTERVRLGASVFILGHRNPIVMAKMLTTIDTLSNGRLICGVGVAWWAEEFAVLGVPFESRGRLGDETIRIFKELWTAAEPQFAGEFYRFSQIGFAPKPVQKPHPPIWVGGHSQAAFRRAVTLGDGWHGTRQRPEDLRDSLARLRKAADKAGRPFEDLELSLRLPLGAEALQGSRQAIIDQYCAYQDLGLSHLVVDFRRNDLSQMLEVLDLLATQIRPTVEASAED